MERYPYDIANILCFLEVFTWRACTIKKIILITELLLCNYFDLCKAVDCLSESELSKVFNRCSLENWHTQNRAVLHSDSKIEISCCKPTLHGIVTYWVTQKLPQICTLILRIRIGKVAWFAVYICGNFWVTQYEQHGTYIRW